MLGGQFSQINGQAINNLAKWNGTLWSGFGHPANGITEAIASYNAGGVSDCNLYTGGEVLFNQWKCTGVAVSEKSFSLNIAIFPNPVTEKIHIQWNKVIPEKVYISIYSLLGSRIINRPLIPLGQSSEVDISALPSGTYLMKVYTNKGSVLKKLVKG